MDRFFIGQVVTSKSGRDKGLPFIVVEIVSDKYEYLFLVDGKLRLLGKPKKKKIMHVQPHNEYVDNEYIADIKHKLENGLYLKDSDFRKALESISGRTNVG